MWWKVVGGLLALWLVLSLAGAVVGFVVESLFLLAVLGGGAFLAVAALNRSKKGTKQLK